MGITGKSAEKLRQCLLLLLLTATLYSCGDNSDTESQDTDVEQTSDESAQNSVTEQSAITGQEQLTVVDEQETLVEQHEFLIGAFNLHVFGPSRLEDAAAMAITVSIARRYDLLVLQELKNKDGEAITELLNQINAAGDVQYGLRLSARSGRSAQKEQYGYLYRLDRVNILDFYDDDDVGDHFEREPSIAYVDFAGVTLSVITLHAKPENEITLFELNRLVPVYEDAVLRTGDDDAIILGDLNADCSYLKEADMPYVKLRDDARFTWLIHDDADTTVRASTHCAYDRIIATTSLMSDIQEETAMAFNFDTYYGLTEEQSLDVSDHYPVEVKLLVTKTQ